MEYYFTTKEISLLLKTPIQFIRKMIREKRIIAYPKHTHVINKHIYRHTYSPQYSCSEENQMINVQCGSCSQFR